MSKDELRAVHAHVQEDLENQRLIPVALDLEPVFADAGELSRLYAAKFLARSLDLLHVAAAHIALCTTFVSADDRQLARGEGERPQGYGHQASYSSATALIQIAAEPRHYVKVGGHLTGRFCQIGGHVTGRFWRRPARRGARIAIPAALR